MSFKIQYDFLKMQLYVVKSKFQDNLWNFRYHKVV